MSDSAPSQRIVGWVVRHFDTKDGKAWRLFVFKSLAGSSPHKPRRVSIAYSHGDSRSEKVVGSFSVADVSMEFDDASLRLLSSGAPGEELPLTRPSALASVAGGGWLSLSWTDEMRHDLVGTTLMGRAEHLVYIAQVRQRHQTVAQCQAHPQPPFASSAVAPVAGRPCAGSVSCHPSCGRGCVESHFCCCGLG